MVQSPLETCYSIIFQAIPAAVDRLVVHERVFTGGGVVNWFLVYFYGTILGTRCLLQMCVMEKHCFISPTVA